MRMTKNNYVLLVNSLRFYIIQKRRLLYSNAEFFSFRSLKSEINNFNRLVDIVSFLSFKHLGKKFFIKKIVLEDFIL